MNEAYDNAAWPHKEAKMAQDNVRKAKAKHDQKQAKRDANLRQQRSGSLGSRLNDMVAHALRGPKRRNS